MKSRQSRDEIRASPVEIVRFAHDEIKSVLCIPHVSADFIAQRFHPRLRGFIPSVRTDLVEKALLFHGGYSRQSREDSLALAWQSRLPISGRRMRTTRLAAAPPTRGRSAHPPPRKKAPDWAPSCVSVTVNLDAFP